MQICGLAAVPIKHRSHTKKAVWLKYKWSQISQSAVLCCSDQIYGLWPQSGETFILFSRWWIFVVASGRFFKHLWPTKGPFLTATQNKTEAYLLRQRPAIRSNRGERRGWRCGNWAGCRSVWWVWKGVCSCKVPGRGWKCGADKVRFERSNCIYPSEWN